MQLKPVLGPVGLSFYSVGVIIGAGIYSVIGAAAGLAQHDLWLSFVVGALVALPTAISYAEMATTFPAAGAEYIYVRRTWPEADWLAFGIGIVILAGGAIMATTVAIAFGGYLRTLVDVPVALSALALLVGCTALNVWGLQESSRMNIAFTLVEVAGLLLVIAAALFYEGAAVPAPPPATAPEPSVMAAAALLFFVYLGFEEIANLAEETQNPARNIPLALFVSLGVTALLYVATALAVVHLAPSDELAASEAPLATAIFKVWPGAGRLLGAIALFATANTVLITLIATSRLAFSLARDREIPAVFAKLLPGRGTPWVAALLVLVMAAAALPVGDIAILAELSSFSALVAFVAVNVILIVLRYRRPDIERPFRAPLAIGRMPLLPLAAIAGTFLLLVYFDWRIWAAGGIAVVLGALAFAARQWARRKNN